MKIWRKFDQILMPKYTSIRKNGKSQNATDGARHIYKKTNGQFYPWVLPIPWSPAPTDTWKSGNYYLLHVLKKKNSSCWVFGQKHGCSPQLRLILRVIHPLLIIVTMHVQTAESKRFRIRRAPEVPVTDKLSKTSFLFHCIYVLFAPAK